ncbi:ImmA/IrrE family metallo-endopeptidase [Sutcliffiella horikoshii]|uniref:ImmA/IrrE family metallo-endopeptidase n=1 Tax=Sutcliffiella horikoshii TaxID=79883 RepID=UPI001CBC2421|nr:ImmA/IrrE family metallo-endopeptidase [Sutcliffiella horikoshii]
MNSYSPMPLEIAISNLFKRLQIFKPEQISEKKIARDLRIFLTTKPIRSVCYENGRFQSINIDQRLPVEMQREQFYHELCHLLRHSGWQLGIMPRDFHDLQEWDARNFVRYAAIPYHMLQFIDIDDPYVVDNMASVFKVTHELCQERLEQLQRRVHCAGL